MEEEEKLHGALQLDPKELELVIDTTTFVLQQAAYHLAKPSLLKTQLAAIGLQEEKVREKYYNWMTPALCVVIGTSLHSRMDVPRQGYCREIEIIYLLP